MQIYVNSIRNLKAFVISGLDEKEMAMHEAIPVDGTYYNFTQPPTKYYYIIVKP